MWYRAAASSIRLVRHPTASRSATRKTCPFVSALAANDTETAPVAIAILASTAAHAMARGQPQVLCLPVRDRSVCALREKAADLRA